MTFEFIKKNDKLILKYSPETGTEWIEDEYFKYNFSLTLKRIFQFTKKQIYEDSELTNNNTNIYFLLATLQDNNFYSISKEIIQTKWDVLIYKDANINEDYFGLKYKQNIIKYVENIAQSQIIISKDGFPENSIPIEIFEKLLSNFPTLSEKTNYVNSKISQLLIEFVEYTKDYGKLYEKYMKQKKQLIKTHNTLSSIKEYEKNKYSFILAELNEMLKNPDIYSEETWQDKILDIITLIYPKYLLSISKLNIKDYTQEKTKNRYIDIALFDINGNIDIIEIKKPFAEKGILTHSRYRDNFLPSRELSGAIMQTEKYIYHINRMGNEGEKFLTKKYKDKLSKYNLRIQITNPKGIIIAGLSSKFDKTQRLDFEIIRRKYANIIDIITYDDLINRLKNLIQKFS